MCCIATDVCCELTTGCAGGYLATNLAARHPDIVSGLILLNATPFWSQRPPPGQESWLWKLLQVDGTVPVPLVRPCGTLWCALCLVTLNNNVALLLVPTTSMFVISKYLVHRCSCLWCCHSLHCDSLATQVCSAAFAVESSEHFKGWQTHGATHTCNH